MLSISDIESRIVTRFDNPNVLYGIYQGVSGAPKISTKSYHGATVHTVLAEAGKTYVNSNGIVRSDNQTAMITPIYLWHKDTLFGGDDAKLIAHVRNHAAPGLASDLYKTRTVAAVPLNYRADNFEVPRQRDNRTRGSVSSSGGFGS
jgi:hypothetical protein